MSFAEVYVSGNWFDHAKKVVLKERPATQQALLDRISEALQERIAR
jgi:hypothetical protein